MEIQIGSTVRLLSLDSYKEIFPVARTMYRLVGSIVTVKFLHTVTLQLPVPSK